MLIGFPQIAEAENGVRLTAEIVSDLGGRRMYYSLPLGYDHWFSTDRCDGFVVGLLFQAMALNEEIRTLSPMSSKLYHSLQEFLIPMLVQTFPHLHSIRIHPAALIDSVASGKGVASGFSGGIDSFACVVQHWAQEKQASHKISHVLFHNAGSHSTGDHEAARRLFRQRYETLKPFSEETDIPFVPMDSNVSELFPIDFIRMHPALNASFLLVIQQQFTRYYYASAYKYADCGVCYSDDAARLDPMAFHLYSTEGLDCVSTGAQLSRVEKTQLVTAFEPSRRYLNVCVDPAYEGRNCSICFKCRRTLMTLDLLDKAEEYREVFDLEKFRAKRNAYLVRLLRYKKGSFEAEIADLIRQKSDGPVKTVFGLRKWWDQWRWR